MRHNPQDKAAQTRLFYGKPATSHAAFGSIRYGTVGYLFGEDVVTGDGGLSSGGADVSGKDA